MDQNTPHPLEIRSKEEIHGRNIAFFLNGASNSPTLELHLAVILDLARKGNKMTAYECVDSFQSPTDNPFNRKSISSFAKFRIRDALKNLDVRLITIDLRNESAVVNPKTAENLELGVMSSFASLLKLNSKEEMSPKWQRAYENMLDSAKRLYNYFTKELQQQKYDFVFTYNGRFGDVRPVLDAARDAKVAFGLYDMKRVINEIVFVNELVHSIEGNNRRALAYYEEDPKRAEDNAKKFFKNKIENKPTGDHIYTKAQTRGALPERVINSHKKIIAVYPSSDDEFKFIGKEWDGHVPDDQAEEINKLASGLPKENYLIVVKMHPNQSNAPEKVLEKYLHLEKKYPHVVVETPASKKDTYALMERAHVVVTFASTVGVEACHARKPVVLIGDTNWSRLDIAHKVYDGSEAAELIKKGLTPKPILGTIIWGNYMLSYKDTLPDFKLIENGDYLVAGRRIGYSTWRRILQWGAKLEMSLERPGFHFGLDFLRNIGQAVVNLFKRKWKIN